jgi:hypothetical protein
MRLQSAVNKIAIWTKKCRIKLNESQPIFINGTQVSYANAVKYLGMTLDAK